MIYILGSGSVGDLDFKFAAILNAEGGMFVPSRRRDPRIALFMSEEKCRINENNQPDVIGVYTLLKHIGIELTSPSTVG